MMEPKGPQSKTFSIHKFILLVPNLEPLLNFSAYKLGTSTKYSTNLGDFSNTPLELSHFHPDSKSVAPSNFNPQLKLARWPILRQP